MIALTQGKISIKQGRVACSCCQATLDISLGTEADCDCFYQRTEENPIGVPRPCFNAEYPAPLLSSVGGQLLENVYYPTAYYGGEFAIQIPWDFTTSPREGWKSFVTQPTNVRMSGNVGGDVLVIGRRVVGSSRYEGSPSGAVSFTAIANENEFPCGTCQRNGGAHPFEIDWVMYPYTTYLVHIRTYLSEAGGQPICAPWLRATLQRLAPVAP